MFEPYLYRASQDIFGGGSSDQMGDKVLCPEQGVGNWASLCQESKIYLDRSWKGQFWKGIFRLDYGIIISNGLLFQAMFYMSNTKKYTLQNKE